jgi:hypothetical protein
VSQLTNKNAHFYLSTAFVSIYVLSEKLLTILSNCGNSGSGFVATLKRKSHEVCF